MFFCFFNEWFQLGNLTISVSNPTLTWVWKQSWIEGIRSSHFENILLTALRLAPTFDSSKTYVYKYETWLVNGLPEEKLARSGLKFTSEVQISVVSGNMHLIKVFKKPAHLGYAWIFPFF